MLCATLPIAVCNIAINTLPQCYSYIDNMLRLQHCCTSATILPAMLQQQYKTLCVWHCTDITSHSVQHCINNIATVLLLHWHHVRIVTLMHRVTTLPMDISVQHCGNIAACQPNCVSAMSPSNVTATVQNLVCSTLHWHCKSQCATLHQQHCHNLAATLTSFEDCNIEAPCYNVTNIYFCATLRQCCSVSTKFHFSNVSQQC